MRDLRAVFSGEDNKVEADQNSSQSDKHTDGVQYDLTASRYDVYECPDIERRESPAYCRWLIAGSPYQIPQRTEARNAEGVG